MKHIQTFESINEAKSINPKQKGIGKFLGSVNDIDVIMAVVFFY